MSYFTKFPHIVYEFNGKETVVKDILRRVAFLTEYKPYTDLYQTYTIIDGDTPQSLAIKFYGIPTYHWIVLMFNEIHNPYFDWPLDTANLDIQCKEHYGPVTMYMTRHYEIDGAVIGEINSFSKTVQWVSPKEVPFALPVSFYEHEQKLNDERRIIKVLRPELLGEFVTQFEKHING